MTLAKLKGGDCLEASGIAASRRFIQSRKDLHDLPHACDRTCRTFQQWLTGQDARRYSGVARLEIVLVAHFLSAVGRWAIVQARREPLYEE